MKFLGNFATLDCVKTIIPCSSKTGVNQDVIIEEILKWLPSFSEKNFEFDDDMYTSSSVRFMTAEIIREKALFLLNEELPHGLAIDITKFDENGTVAHIDVDLICEKENHKSIILGKGGTKIKEIGSQARSDIEKLLDKKVMLKIFVKVDKNWRQKKITVV